MRGTNKGDSISVPFGEGDLTILTARLLRDLFRDRGAKFLATSKSADDAVVVALRRRYSLRYMTQQPIKMMTTRVGTTIQRTRRRIERLKVSTPSESLLVVFSYRLLRDCRALRVVFLTASHVFSRIPLLESLFEISC